MAKVKYQFNPETLSYTKIENSFSRRFYQALLPQFSVSIILGILFFIAASFTIDSPLERVLKEENETLTLKYEMLNRRLSGTSLRLESLEKRDDNVYRQIFQAAPIPLSIRKAGFGGSDRYKKFEGYKHSSLIIETEKKLDVISKRLVVQSKSYDDIIKLVKHKEKMLASLPAIQPIANKDLTRFGSPFGYRMHPILGYMKLHAGVDLSAPTGTKIYAAGDGYVTKADAASRGYGNHVRINHGYGYATVYGHLSKILIKPGQKVKRGDVIGLVGSTGLSTSPHLHYEVRINNKPVNPVNFYYNDLTDSEYEQMIEMSSKSNTHVFE